MTAPPPRGALAARAGLLAIALAAFALRARGAAALDAGGGALPAGDAADHARRALWTAQHWPSLLGFDPLLAFPEGAWLTFAPLGAWLAGGLARGLGGDVAAVEGVARWLPPLLGALATVPVYAATARLAGRGPGLAAAAAVAGAPLAIRATAAGALGPPAWLAPLSAAWLWAALRAAGPGAPGQTLLGVCSARVATLLAAPGGGLRVALADGALLLALARDGRRAALRRHALGLLASGLVVLAALAAAAPPGARGPWLASLAAGGGPDLAALALAVRPAAGALACALAALVLAARAAGRAPQGRAAARVLAPWLAGFGVLALLGGPAAGAELAAPAAVAAAAGGAALWRSQRGGARAGAVAAVAAAALAVLALPAWRGGAPAGDLDPAALAAFADAVRAATPETPAFDDPAARPADGILAPPALGPMLRWRARRAVAERALAGLAGAPREREAVALAEAAGARFVALPARARAGFFAQVVAGHADPPAERVRLVAATEHAALLEVVAGAVIEVAAPPGTPVSAQLALDTPSGRRVQRAATIAADDGVARLRVPYPGGGAGEAEPVAPFRARGPWRIRVGELRFDVPVGEHAVRTGASVRHDGGAG